MLVFGQETTEIPIVSYDQFKAQMNQEDDVVIYNFWATWCKPCVEELPYFESINKSFRNKGVKVVVVSLDLRLQY